MLYGSLDQNADHLWLVSVPENRSKFWRWSLRSGIIMKQGQRLSSWSGSSAESVQPEDV